MKVMLYILLALQILASCVLFLLLISQSFLLAVLYLFIGALQVVLTLAVITNMDTTEGLQYEVSRLRAAVRELQKAAESDDPDVQVRYPADSPAETAQNTWVCVKCGTVNKADIARCAHCGAAYSASVNPTDDPLVKRQRSRWIKEEKKRPRLFGKKANS